MFRTALKSLLLAAFLASTSVAAEQPAPFPDLVDVDCKPVTTEANLGKGKWQLVMIWAIDCPVCKIMKPKLSKFHNKHKDIDAEVYGVALDGHANADAVKAYMVEHNVSFPTYVGEFSLVAANFEINSQVPLRGTPTYLLFSPEGELLGIDHGLLDVPSIESFIERNS